VFAALVFCKTKRHQGTRALTTWKEKYGHCDLRKSDPGTSLISMSAAGPALYYSDRVTGGAVIGFSSPMVVGSASDSWYASVSVSSFWQPVKGTAKHAIANSVISFFTAVSTHSTEFFETGRTTDVATALVRHGSYRQWQQATIERSC